MIKSYVFGVALLVALSINAMTAASASASVEWLAGKKPITEAEGPLVVKMAGVLELTDSETSFGAMTVKCEDIRDGTVGPAKEDLVEKPIKPGGRIN